MVSLDSDGGGEDYPDVGAIYQLGRADFRSGYPRTWTPHLGELASDEIAWSIWVSGWEDAQHEYEDMKISIYRAINGK